MKVRFACICDSCGKKERDYQWIYSCKDCGDDFCEKCMSPKDLDPEQLTGLCQACQTHADFPEEGDL